MNLPQDFVSKQLSRKNNSLMLDGVSLDNVAQQYGTPVYVYSANHIAESFKQYQNAVAGYKATICYAVKANSNLAILRMLSTMGAGFDIVSAGELIRVLEAGADPSKIVFSGVGKSSAEIELALQHNIGCFNVESAAELERISQIALALNTTANISLRVNPDVDAQTHPYISTGLKENKFGVTMDQALNIYAHAAKLPNLKIIGVDCHIGSQITQTAPYVDALNRVLNLIDQLHQHGIVIQHLDLGGGLGIRYQDETPPSPEDVIGTLIKHIKDWADTNQRPLPALIFEPGRSIVGNAGVLLTRVEYLKHNEDKAFAIVDAAMNDLMRPAMYESFHDMVKVNEDNPPKVNVNTIDNRINNTTNNASANTYDIVGPVCETGDWLGKNRQLHLESGDIIAILSAGAYGMSMASNYNTRPRAAEVLVKDGAMCLIRKRETLDDLLQAERLNLDL
jgi:diaminopimelate decarboxylase